ncbi:MAG: CHAT domain-containing tetratricopeptide repeat protein [Bacteroidales bacterium]
MKRFLLSATLGALVSFALNAQPWIRADSLRYDFLKKGRFDSALYYTEEAAALMRGTIGEDNLQYASMLRKLAVSHFYLANYKKGMYFIMKEVAIREKQKKTEDNDYITCLETAALICRKAGSYEAAYEYIKKADAKAVYIYDLEGPLYAEVLYQMAGVYHDMGFSINDMIYVRAEEKALKRAEAIYSRYGERKINEYLINLSDQASWNNNVGNAPEAESVSRKVVELCRSTYGAESAGYASSLNNLGVLYYNEGNYKQAEKSLVDALAICKGNAGISKSLMSVCLNNLGALYNEIGNYTVAENLIGEAKDLMQKASLDAGPDYAAILNNVGAVSLAEEFYAAPENKNKQRLQNSGRLIKMADSVFRLNCQKPHAFSHAITGNLSLWYSLSGDKKKSAQIASDLTYESNLSLKVIAMMNKMGSSYYLPFDSLTKVKIPETVIIPISIRMFEEMMTAGSGTASSESDAITRGIIKLFMGKATNIKKAVGPYHPAYATMLKALIATYANVDDVKSVEELTLEYMDVIDHKTLQDFSFLSESEKELYYQIRLPDVYSFLSYSLTRKRLNPQITRYTYNNILLSKGLMLKSSTAMRLAILNSNNKDLLQKYDKWIELQKEISTLYSTPVEMRTKDVSQLEKQATELERELVSSSLDFSDYRKGLQVTWLDVKKSLKPDEAAIEFTDFKKKERDGGNAVIYCALVLRSNSDSPEMVKLFTEEQLKSVLSKNESTTVFNINDIYGTTARPDDRLYDLIWKPVEQYLQGVRSVYISPSGLLNKVSFPAISNGKNVYLCDQYRIEVKGSTGNVASGGIFAGGSNPSALILGGIEYSASANDDPVWTYLKGTKDEGDAVDRILENGAVKVKYLSGSNATESFFKQYAAGYSILHIATHGFFFNDPNEVRLVDNKKEVEFGQVTFRGATRGFGVNSFVNNENPLMRSGLVLAGANDVWVKPEKGETDDGVLTAQEVTQIDMRKNDLVVLSACETALGDIKGTEGVYGLQRALKMAGVKYIIMSLWSIPDRETVEFMKSFYSHLIEDKDVRSAFYKSQREMRAKYDPYYWGAFVLLE